MQFFNILICPKCGKDLKIADETLLCSGCGQKFFVKNDVPIFIDNELLKKSVVESHLKNSSSGLGRKIVGKIFTPLHHSVYMDTLESSNNDGKKLESFLASFKPNQIVVNVGSLSKKIKTAGAEKQVGPEIINLDISYYPNIDIVADAHHLPFKDGSIDGVIIKNVFEHLRDPIKVRNELKRVLKNGGRVYAKVPFLQPFHAVPDDYQRYTANGLDEFFKDFKIVEKGISVGPSSALAWFLQEYFGILFSFNTSRGYNIAKTIASWVTAPLKYFDFFFRNKKEAHRLASAFYIILEK